MLCYNNGRSNDPQYEQITDKNFGRWFDTERYKFEDLVLDFEALRKNIIKANTDKMNKQSDATMALIGIGDESIKEQYKTKDYYFFSTIDCGVKYTKADDEFIFNNLYKDLGKNLYWKLNDKLYLLNFKLSGERELVGNTNDADSQFWPDFFRMYEAKFDEWNRKITTIVQSYDWNDANNSIEKTLLDSGIPRIWLECLMLKVRMKGVEQENDKGKKEIVWYNEGATVALNGAAGKQQYTKRNLIELLSKTLLVSVDINRLPIIPTYSNNRQEVAIKYLDVPTCKNPKSEPKLPPMWDKFLGGTRFFNPYMDKMKIACFLCNTLNAKYSGRQVLCVGGEGEDGKGVFLRILDLIMGTDHTTNVPFSAFSESDQFGLASIINKKFVYLSDCKYLSKLFESDKFKQLTGHDKLSINRKNMDFFNYMPDGTTFAAITNHPFYVNSEYGRSRVMPLVFRKNFKSNEMIDKHEMEEKLLAEKDEFLQWCVDYRYWLNNVICKGNLLHGSQLIMCTDQDMKLVADGEYDPVKLFKTMCESETLKMKPFCNWNNYEETDDDAEAYRPMFEDLFVKTDDENDVVAAEDMRCMLESLITENNKYLDCFDTTKIIDENKHFMYKIKFIGNNPKWRHWNDFLKTKLELVKKRNADGKFFWHKLKPRTDVGFVNSFVNTVQSVTSTVKESVKTSVLDESDENTNDFFKKDEN